MIVKPAAEAARAQLPTFVTPSLRLLFRPNLFVHFVGCRTLSVFQGQVQYSDDPSFMSESRRCACHIGLLRVSAGTEVPDLTVYGHLLLYDVSRRGNHCFLSACVM